MATTCTQCPGGKPVIGIQVAQLYPYGTLFYMCTRCGFAKADPRLTGELWETADNYARRHNATHKVSPRMSS